jgi:type II secretory pathway pseudopilin PulG
LQHRQQQEQTEQQQQQQQEQRPAYQQGHVRQTPTVGDPGSIAPGDCSAGSTPPGADDPVFEQEVVKVLQGEFV